MKPCRRVPLWCSFCNIGVKGHLWKMSKMSKLQDTHIVMNKGEINTGESNENENVHKFNESVVSKNCCFKVKFVPFCVICNYRV
jgi:hypothetical protein